MRITLYILALVFIASSCNSQIAESESYKRVNNTEWADALAQVGGSAQIIDVRTPAEFEDGNIDGSINIDFLADGFIEKMNGALNKEETIYIYCQSGGRSARAAALLAADGYKRIIELETGFSGYPE